MKKRFFQSILYVLFVSVSMCVCSAQAQDGGAPIPQDKIDALEAALTAPVEESFAARQRLAVKRIIRDGDALLEANPTAPNRFEILGLLFGAQQKLFGMDDSTRNREALLETCEELAEAPDEYAALRLDAEILLTQTRLAREGADAGARLEALMPLVARYRRTPGDAKMLRVALVMALETGNPKVIKSLRDEMAVRFAGDLDMIAFQREKLGGQILGAPICGTFKRSDGGVMHFPGDALGKITVLYFWSQEDPADDHVQRLAAEWKTQKNEISDRLNIVSFNVDQLPDAGEKILRDFGVDWPALHLPGGRDNPFYKTFPKSDPYMMTVAPTGYVALIMSGSTRRRASDTGKTDFERWFQSGLARDWSRPRYITQLTSLFAGDFLVVDPEGPFDPTLPPEIKALSTNPTPLKRTAASVPEETLRAIQECFAKPPLRYRMPAGEIKANYQKAEALCAKAIAAHPDAPDLWIVRNRHIVAQLGLWKLTSDHTHYQRAVEEAKSALDSGMPSGTEVAAQFCLAKEALRAQGADPRKVISEFIEAIGPVKDPIPALILPSLLAPGPALAAASLLALDAGDRGLHEEYRDLILERHLEHPVMWTFVSFLLDRYHRYWIFRVPFTAGWSYGRQQQWIMSRGQADEVDRRIEAELQTLDGKPYRLPEDSVGKWTVVLFTNSWVNQERPSLPGTVTRYLSHIEKRGLDDVQVIVAVVDGEVAPIQAYLKENPLNCETLVLPGGAANPLVQQLGILDEDEIANALVLCPDGSIAAALSGLTMGRVKGQLVPNLIAQHDEQTVSSLLEHGEIEKAKELIFKLAPPYDPEAVDERGHKLKKPVYSDFHLRARARVYVALEEWDAALADAEEVVKFLTAKGGWMSMRPEALDEAEDLLESIQKKRDEAGR